MSQGEDITLGEVSRQLRNLNQSFDAHRKETADNYLRLSNQMQATMGPVSEIKVRMERAEHDINALGAKRETDKRQLFERIEQLDLSTDKQMRELDAKVDDVKTQAARLSGGIGIIAFVLAMVPWPWKH